MNGIPDLAFVNQIAKSFVNASEISPGTATCLSPAGSDGLGQGDHALPLVSVDEPIRVALADDDMGVVHERVDRCCGKGFGHDFIKARRVQITRNG